MTLIRAVLAVGLGLASLPQDSWSLQSTAKVGEKITYRNRMEGRQPDGKAVTMDRVMEREVLKIENDGTRLTRLTGKSALIRVGGDEFRSDEEVVTEFREGPRGELVRIEKGRADLESYRLGHITRYISPPAPVKLGESWRFERAAGRPEGIPGAMVRFVLDKVEAVGSKQIAFIKFTYSEPGEAGCTASGDWQIDVASGEPIEMKAEIENFSKAFTGKAQISMTRVK